jgi:hypothetical protein
MRPQKWEEHSEQFQKTFKMLRSEQGWPTIRGQNLFVENVPPVRCFADSPRKR